MSEVNLPDADIHSGYSSTALRRLAVVALAALVGGCAPVSPTASEDRALFEALCNAPDRNFTKFRPKVNGYAEGDESGRGTLLCPLTAAPFNRIVIDGYSYYECFERPWVERGKEPLKAVRVELKKEGDPTCELARLAKENKIAERKRARYPQLDKQCFGGEVIANPKSRFVLILGGGVVDKSGGHLLEMPKDWPSVPGSISFSRDRIIDQQTGQIIAERKKYSYYPSGSRYADFTGREKCDEGWRDLLEVFSPASSK